MANLWQVRIFYLRIGCKIDGPKGICKFRVDSFIILADIKAKLVGARKDLQAERRLNPDIKFQNILKIKSKNYRKLGDTTSKTES